MQLTKFEHACFSLEKDGKALLFDPGNYTHDLTVPDNVIAVILTHEHADHCDKNLLREILDKNPAALLLAPHEMSELLSGMPIEGIAPGGNATVGPFELRFFGGEHAIIHPSIDSVVNVGVLVNDTFYYPGDSFTAPNVPIKTVALPVTAPWLRISDSIDFMLKVKPELAFPVHDYIASEEGKTLVDRIIGGFAGKENIRYERISGTVDVD